MADVQRPSFTTRASAAKRPREAASSSPSVQSSNKRPRTSPDAESQPIPGLPADFFDGGSRNEDVRKATGDIVVQQGPTPPNENAAGALPADFFSTSGGGQEESTAQVDEDEWAAFEAEVAAPTRVEAVITAAPVLHGEKGDAENVQQEEEAEDEEYDEAKERLLEEFEEMQTLEQRVQKLKEKREELRRTLPTVAPMDISTSYSSTAVDGTEEDDEDDDDDDDEEDWMRSRIA